MDYTENRSYPLPIATNNISDDVLLLRLALAGVDADIHVLLQSVAGKAASDHGHAISGITGLTEALASKAASDHAHVLNDLSDVNIAAAPANNYLIAWDAPTSKWVAKSAANALGTHGHAIGDITDLTNVLAGKAPLANAALTGVPTAPTAPVATNSTQLATTAFVKLVVDALIAGAPGAIDTLNELATALGNDPNFATTMTNALASKFDKTGGTVTGLAEFQGNIRVSSNAAGSHSYLYMKDDESPNGQKSMYANGNYIGWLSGAGAWIARCHDDGTFWTKGLGNLKSGAATGITVAPTQPAGMVNGDIWIEV